MEVRNGVVGWLKSEIPPSFLIVPGQYLPNIGPDGVERWFYISPFNPDPWDEFYGSGPTAPKLPVGFEDIFGPKPTDVQKLEFWQQQLGLFAGVGLPPTVSAAQAAEVEALWKHYLLGAKPVSWQTTRGDYIVTPVGRSELLGIDFGPDAYVRKQQPIAICQIALIGAGVKLPDMVPFLTNFRIEHQG